MAGVQVRNQLPPRRYSENTKLQHRGMTYFVGVGYYEDGRLAEIFVSTSKLGTDVVNTANDACILISYLLQIGTTWSEFDDILTMLQRDEKDDFASIIGVLINLLRNEMSAPVAENMVDLFLPERNQATSEILPPKFIVRGNMPEIYMPEGKKTIARSQGFTGDTCTSCQNMTMRRNGTCLVCATCGTTTGCS